MSAKGYFKIEDIEACEKVGIEPYVPRPQRGPSVKAGLFRKDEFTYDTVGDNDICPAGQRLHPYSSSLLRGLKKVNYVNKLACDDCAIRLRCTGASFARYGAKIAMDWSDVVGGITGKFLPTGNVKDTIEVDGIKYIVSIVDTGKSGGVRQRRQLEDDRHGVSERDRVQQAARGDYRENPQPRRRDVRHGRQAGECQD
jgi:hypothetical protein